MRKRRFEKLEAPVSEPAPAKSTVFNRFKGFKRKIEIAGIPKEAEIELDRSGFTESRKKETRDRLEKYAQSLRRLEKENERQVLERQTTPKPVNAEKLDRQARQIILSARAIGALIQIAMGISGLIALIRFSSSVMRGMREYRINWGNYGYFLKTAALLTLLTWILRRFERNSEKNQDYAERYAYSINPVESEKFSEAMAWIEIQNLVLLLAQFLRRFCVLLLLSQIFQIIRLDELGWGSLNYFFFLTFCWMVVRSFINW